MTKRKLWDRPSVLSGASLPHVLCDLPVPPDEAYLWGQLPPGPRVGLVGTRNASKRGFRIAFEVARELASLGMTIVSGGAWGIDRAAHLGALRGHGRTLVVAPVWLGRAFPEANRKLFRTVLERGGGYLTVSRSEDVPFFPTFRRRNEILVSLCDVLLLGEMGVPSGTLMAAGFARQYDRPAFVLPWHVGARDTRGVQVELERGTPGYFRAGQLVRLLQGRRFDNPTYWERSPVAMIEPPKKRRRTRSSDPFSEPPDSSRAPSHHPSISAPPGDPVFEAIARGATTVDALALHTGLSAAVVQHRVLLLTLQGVVLRDTSGLLRVRE